MNPKPAERVMTGAAVGLVYAGISLDQFDPTAPLCGCRLCGKVYQTRFHRELHWDRKYIGENYKLLTLVLDLNNLWRESHTKSCHTQAEVDSLAATGAAFTPEAANLLAPYGIIPMGNMNQDIVDGMFEADRKPDLTHLEGGE